MSLTALLLAAIAWQPLQAGVEHARVGELQVVRVDPEHAELQLALRSREGGPKRTAAQWADERGFSVAINAGMFKTDQLSNVGRLVDGDHQNQAGYNEYQSALVFGPRKVGLPRAQVLDLDAPGAKQTAAEYGAVVQNLRLIKAPGVSVWKKNQRRWSEAAIAQDSAGRLLFVFSREPHQMADFNALLLGADLDVVRAFHVEGGPEASLSVHTKGLHLDLCGSYETGFTENDDNARQWELPNVLGVKQR